MSNFVKRVATALVGIPLIALALFAYDGAAVPAVLLTVLGLLLWECAALVGFKSVALKLAYCVIGATALLWLYVADMTWELNATVSNVFFTAGIAVPLLGLTLAHMSQIETRKIRSVPEELGVIARSALGIGCLWVLVISVAALYLMHRHVGVAILIWTLAVAWVTDTGAYVIGKTLGKRPLARRISPSKTLEGTLGGYLAGVVVSLLISFLWLQPTYHWPTLAVALFATIAPIIAIGGDLYESIFKRIVEVKDSGAILPGHGGLLDRLDSVIVLAPFTFAFAMIMLDFYS